MREANLAQAMESDEHLGETPMYPAVPREACEKASFDAAERRSERYSQRVRRADAPELELEGREHKCRLGHEQERALAFQPSHQPEVRSEVTPEDRLLIGPGKQRGVGPPFHVLAQGYWGDAEDILLGQLALDDDWRALAFV